MWWNLLTVPVVLILHGLLGGGQHTLHENKFKLTGVSERYFMVHAMVIKVREADNKEDQGWVPKAPTGGEEIIFTGWNHICPRKGSFSGMQKKCK